MPQHSKGRLRMRQLAQQRFSLAWYCFICLKKPAAVCAAAHLWCCETSHTTWHMCATKDIISCQYLLAEYAQTSAARHRLTCVLKCLEMTSGVLQLTRCWRCKAESIQGHTSRYMCHRYSLLNSHMLIASFVQCGMCCLDAANLHVL